MSKRNATSKLSIKVPKIKYALKEDELIEKEYKKYDEGYFE